MNFRSFLSAAGFGHLPTWQVTGGSLVLVATVGLSLIKLTGISAFGIAGAVLSAAALAELFLALATMRSQSLIAALPEVAESLASGVASGQDLGQSIALLAQHGPKVLRKSFLEFNALVDRGFSLEQGLG